MTVQELGDLWDVPILLLDSMSEANIEHWGADDGYLCLTALQVAAHRCRSVLLIAVFWGGGMGGRMGGTGGGAKRVREPSVPPGPRPLSNLELGLSSSSTTKRQRMEEPQDKVLAGTVIKGNSQKAGNKSVPDHLWLRAFVTGYGDASCGARHREALNLPTGDVGSLGAPEPPGEWRGAIPRFRIFALRYWRADMMRGYITWQRTNVPLPASNGSQMVRYQRQWGSNGEDLVYEWTGGGRRFCRTEWQDLWASSEGKTTVAVGYDAIHRCAEFEWLKGLAPLV